ncbi:5-(carboxyamino)imidazole ribonucleotide synthase [Roseimaritima ulvae]|uniref:N5-carboxyaminoimidazole ribonucleotide synthase n=1 Tax=Roseimaritima ulvae TaxID=980254 RepID=A0A5B9QMN3_9BACT|nr:5-(carboxyamino)imidazole ribonucleotide synthase [Roseimaritima ulvae]QEG38880.1 N5-carboxyaminoimidazole ribonucleotide synthase [Roseimaritima ulvae]
MDEIQPLRPGATIGMLGGGQLGRMFTLAAQQMGYRVAVLSDEADGPAAQVANEVLVGDYTPELLAALAKRSAVVTLEFENIPDAAVRQLAAAVPTYPNAQILKTAQDRSLEKQTLADLGLPVTPFRTIPDPSSPAGLQQLRQAGQELGYPMILKTARSGYDGKGQRSVSSEGELAAAAEAFGPQRIVAEQRIAFDREVSILVARNPQGQTAVYPLLENIHRNHILDVSKCPADVPPSLDTAAEAIARTVAERLDLVGLLCIELFVGAGEELMINEIAPRPHNSGHLTIEASVTNQFEQHVRAVCGLPLGQTSLRCPAAMVNLLGDLWTASGASPAFEQSLAVPGVSLHLYGKAEAREGRKMGHLTAVGETVQQAEQRVREAFSRL